jgi:2-phosphoglycerate kinase
LQQRLQAMGVKSRHAAKASAKAFLILQQRAALAPTESYSLSSLFRTLRSPDHKDDVGALVMPRQLFERLIMESLEPHHPPGALSTSIADLRSVTALHERRIAVTIILCGTSGTGKSTLASLLAARLGITTVVSTDSVRHLLRGFARPDEQPLLWVSTYQAEAALTSPKTDSVTDVTTDGPAKFGVVSNASSDAKSTAVQAYLGQAETVMAHVDRLITACEARQQSLVVEGVHASPALVVRLMRRHPSVVPFLVHISNESKHLERFAVRAKAMTLRPEGNKYVAHLRIIRAIQDHLCAAADRRAVPKVDNTNVDRSVATIHATVLGCLRRMAAGEALFDPGTGQCMAVYEEYALAKGTSWSGSDVLEVIRKKRAQGELTSAAEGPSTSAASTSARGLPLLATSSLPFDTLNLTREKDIRGPSSSLQGMSDTHLRSALPAIDVDQRSFFESGSQSTEDGDVEHNDAASDGCFARGETEFALDEAQDDGVSEDGVPRGSALRVEDLKV